VRLALIHDVFFDDPGHARLRATLREARDRGAELALLPELPLHPWVPAGRGARDEDAEPPDGPRARAQAEAAAEAGLALVGGAIVRDPASGARHNTALLFGADGSTLSRYRKLHLPDEPGFHEGDHYEPGDEPPAVVEGTSRGLPLRLGLQLCSDVNRPVGLQLLAAQGVELVVHPRATERATWERWRLSLAAAALTGACFVASVNRPGPERGVALGGPSFVAGPDGRALFEGEERLAVVGLDPGACERARRGYPGYLAHPAPVYAAGWARLAERVDRERRPGAAGSQRPG
jgi:N-carbamoylputrescine amidase